VSAFGPLLRKELLETPRDRRTLLLMIVVPVLLYPALLVLMGKLSVAGRERLAAAELTVGLCGGDSAALLSPAQLPPRTHLARFADRTQGEAALRRREVWMLVDAQAGSLRAVEHGEQARVTLLYTRRYDRSIEAKSRMAEALRKIGVRITAERLEASRLPETFATPIKTEEQDVDFLSDLGPLVVSRILPVMLLMMLFVGAFYPAADLTAGEKERGTLETLLVAPVRPLEVMAAKYLTVIATASLAAVANLVALAATLAVGFGLDEGLRLSMRLSAGQLGMLGLALVAEALLVSALSLAVASLARGFREAQTLLTPLLLIGIVPGMAATMPGLELNSGLALVPLLNLALLIKAVILGTAGWHHLALTVASSLACAAAAVVLAANAFRSEAVRFGGPESWRELFRARR
jgi:sodium transport system permease protein